MAMLNLVISIVNALLMVIVLVGGIILMAMRRRDHGRGASLGISGCVVMLLGLIAQTVISFTIPSLISSLGRAAYEVVLPLSNAFAILTQVVGTALLVFGVIARRTPAPAAAGHPQAWPPRPRPSRPARPAAAGVAGSPAGSAGSVAARRAAPARAADSVAARARRAARPGAARLAAARLGTAAARWTAAAAGPAAAVPGPPASARAVAAAAARRLLRRAQMPRRLDDTAPRSVTMSA